MQHNIMQLTEGHVSAMPEQWPVSLQSKFSHLLLGSNGLIDSLHIWCFPA